MPIAEKILNYLSDESVDFIHFVNISDLPIDQNKGFSSAVLFGIALSPNYLWKVSKDPKYVEKMKQNNEIQNDEFHLSELKTDRIADKLSDLLERNAYPAYSQSEANIEATGFYDKENFMTPLPHKTLALMAGMGWIGKHNLLVAREYGSGISMCSVLTNAPLESVTQKILEPQCGTCNVCVEICEPCALTGNNWNMEHAREHVVNVKNCCTCYQCVVQCPWTKKYAKAKGI